MIEAFERREAPKCQRLEGDLSFCRGTMEEENINDQTIYKLEQS